MIRIIKLPAIVSPLLNYISLYLYILGYYPFFFLSFFLNLESSLIYIILPPEPYLLVAFYLQGRDKYYRSSDFKYSSYPCRYLNSSLIYTWAYLAYA
jgi:hypothetical protein